MEYRAGLRALCRASVGVAFASGLFLPGASALEPVKDVPFVQEFHEAYPLVPEGSANDVRAIAVDTDGTVYAATAEGTFHLNKSTWVRQTGTPEGETFDIVAADGAIWAAAWNGVYRIAEGAAARVGDLTVLRGNPWPRTGR